MTEEKYNDKAFTVEFVPIYPVITDSGLDSPGERQQFDVTLHVSSFTILLWSD